MATVSGLVDESATGASSTGQPLSAGAAAQTQDVPPEEPYFWEAGGNPDVDWWAKLRHYMHFGGVRAIGAAEAIGEVVANVMGLTDSKYQYVIDALESDEYHRQREEREEEDRRKLAAEEAERMRRQHEKVINSQPQDAQVADEHGVELGEAKISLPAELQNPPSDSVVEETT